MQLLKCKYIRDSEEKSENNAECIMLYRKITRVYSCDNNLANSNFY